MRVSRRLCWKAKEVNLFVSVGDMKQGSVAGGALNERRWSRGVAVYKLPKLPSADDGESHPNGRHLDPTNDDIIALI